MNEIELNIDGRVYRLTNRNNCEKYDRAVKDAGQDASPSQILAHYDKLMGYIQDQNGNKLGNGQFWEAEKKRLVETQKRIEKWDKIKNCGGTVVNCIKGFFVILVFTLFIFGLGAWIFGYEEMILFIKKIKELM